MLQSGGKVIRLTPTLGTLCNVSVRDSGMLLSAASSAPFGCDPEVATRSMRELPAQTAGAPGHALVEREGRMEGLELPVEPVCAHHWQIDPPAGSSSHAVCRKCGAERDFRNSEVEHPYRLQRGRRS